eukprot:2746954-Prymnesium_polylepis.1
MQPASRHARSGITQTVRTEPRSVAPTHPRTLSFDTARTHASVTCPCRAAPHASSAPPSQTATVCAAPHASCLTA